MPNRPPEAPAFAAGKEEADRDGGKQSKLSKWIHYKSKAKEGSRWGTNRTADQAPKQSQSSSGNSQSKAGDAQRHSVQVEPGQGDATPVAVREPGKNEPTPPTARGASLWDEAYDLLREEQPKLIEDFEKLLWAEIDEAGTSRWAYERLSPPRDTHASLRERQQPSARLIHCGQQRGDYLRQAQQSN